MSANKPNGKKRGNVRFIQGYIQRKKYSRRSGPRTSGYSSFGQNKITNTHEATLQPRNQYYDEECLPLVNLAVVWDGVVTLALLKYLGAAQEQCQKGQTRLKTGYDE